MLQFIGDLKGKLGNLLGSSVNPAPKKMKILPVTKPVTDPLMFSGPTPSPKPYNIMPIGSPAAIMARDGLMKLGVQPKASPVLGGLQAGGMSRALAPNNVGGMGSAIRNNMNNVAQPINKSQNPIKSNIFKAKAAKSMLGSMFGG